MALNIANALSFLRNDMFNVSDELAKESTKATGTNYYVNSANGLYYTVMHEQDLYNADDLLNTAIAKKAQFGKGNTTIYTLWGDMLHPLWKNKMKVSYAFKNTVEEEWGTLSFGKVLNNNAIGTNRSTNEDKLNVLCAYTIHEMQSYYSTGNSINLGNAQTVWETILNKFNDAAGGYKDAVTDYRESYKQGLVRYCSENFSELRQIGEFQEATGLWDGTLQDFDSGGIYSRYIRDQNGDIVNNGSTFENTESTATVLLAYL